MRLQVKGKNVEVTPSLREYAERKLSEARRSSSPSQTQVEVELSRAEATPRSPTATSRRERSSRKARRSAHARHRRDMKASIDQLADEPRAAGHALPRAAATTSRAVTQSTTATSPPRRRRVRPTSDAGGRSTVQSRPTRRGLSLDATAPAPAPACRPAGLGRRAARRARRPRECPDARRWDAVVTARRARALQRRRPSHLVAPHATLVVDEDGPDDALAAARGPRSSQRAGRRRTAPKAVRRDRTSSGRVAGQQASTSSVSCRPSPARRRELDGRQAARAP